MALISRLFQSRKTQRQSGNCKWPKSICASGWNPPEFKKTQIRLVIFKDHDIRGRNILFDSKSIKKLEDVEKEKKEKINQVRGHGQSIHSKPDLDKSNVISSPAGSPKIQGKYQYLRVSSDTKMLGEMIFGSASLSYRGSSLKVHSIRCPPQLMFTSVFEANVKNRGSSCELENYDSYSLHSSLGDLTPGKQIYCRERTGSGTSSMSIANSVPMEIPMPSAQMHKDQDDSGLSASFCSSGSFTPFPSPSNSSSINSNSYNSLHRRWMRSHQTCLEYGVRRRPERDDGPLHLLQEPTPAWKRQSKIGMGLVIDMFGEREEERNRHFQNFFFSHITLFEAHVDKLRVSVEKAMTNKREFVNIVMEGLDRFRDEIYDLYTAPRLTEPVWLNMMSYTLHRQRICHQFMKEFIAGVEKYETKSTNFFVSTLVTAVLTYHLAWIPTVTPAGAIPSRTYLDKHSAKWLDTLTKSHPYNPLWAQLSDLYGAIGFPPKICRTLVVGKKPDLICKILYILSYFIRCSEVYENIESQEEIRDDELEILNRNADRLTLGEMTPIVEDKSHESSPDQAVASLTEKTRGEIVSEYISKCTPPPGGDQYLSQNTAEELSSPAASDSKHSIQVKVNPLCSNSDSTASVHSPSICSEKTICGTPSDSVFPDAPAIAVKDCDMFNSHNKNYDSDDTLCSTTKSDLTVDLDSSDSDIGRCKLSPLCVPMPKVEDTRHVRRANPESLKTEKVITQAGESGNDSPTKRYMRLPSKDEVVRSDLDDLFDGHGHVVFQGTEGHDTDSSLPDVSQADSMTDSQYSSGTYSMSSCRTHPYTGDSDQADSLFTESYQRDESLDLDEIEIQEKTDSIDTVKKAPVKLTLNIAEILKQRESADPTAAPLSPASCDEVERTLESCGSPPKVARSRSRNNSGEKQQFTRQTSRSTTPGRCRSVTPTELGRRRHVSTASAADSEPFDPFLNLKEMPMPRSEEDIMESNVKAFERNFGRSLLAGYSPCYLSDFVLHGTSDVDYTPKLIADLELASQTAVLDEPVTEAVCIVADADKWEVKLMSSQAVTSGDKPPGMTICPSQLVANLIESVHDMWKLKMSPDFCLMHLEDRLQEIYFKSRMLAEYMRHQKRVDIKDLTSVLGCDSSDVSLLLAVASTHSPQLSFGLL